MSEALSRQSWNNIPLPVRELFDLISDALIGQDIHAWERKSLINERFFKMQHLASKLNDRIKQTRAEMTRWIEDLMKRTYETQRRTDLKVDENFNELNKRQDKEVDFSHR